VQHLPIRCRLVLPTLVAVAVMAAVLAASPLGPSPSSGAAAPTSADQKPALTGLVDMGVQTAYQLDVPFPTVDTSVLTPYAGAFGGIVVNESWAQLEPSSGHEDWSDLIASLDAVQQWNDAHRSTPVGVKLRIFAGNTAPGWAKQLGGPPITIDTKGRPKQFGRWWTAPYRRAWSEFQHALAARFDPDPLVRAVAVTSCGTLTGEPFVLNTSKAAVRTMESAGWSAAAEQDCVDGALADYSGWRRTPVTFAFNPFVTVGDGRRSPDPSVTDAVMASCATSRSRGGPACVLGNNALSDGADSGRSAPVYDEVDALWSRHPDTFGVHFQTVSAGVDCPAIQLAVTHHATSVELWPPNHGYRGFAAVPAATLEGWGRALRTGTGLTCS
jgi:hypothetical protein